MSTSRSHRHSVTKHRLFTTYRNDPTVRIPGWVLYQDTPAKTPIGVLPEPIGGKKNKQGRSPYQAALARFLVTAANAHYALVDASQRVHDTARALADMMPKKHHKLAQGLQALADELAPALAQARRLK